MTTADVEYMESVAPEDLRELIGTLMVHYLHPPGQFDSVSQGTVRDIDDQTDPFEVRRMQGG